MSNLRGASILSELIRGGSTIQSLHWSCAIVGINKHLSIMKHTVVTTEPCRSRKLSLSEQTVIINDERSVLAD